ncbi:MAG: hypothetical protein AMXMBFR47_45630 [Planctomycetota bacterium]
MTRLRFARNLAAVLVLTISIAGCDRPGPTAANPASAPVGGAAPAAFPTKPGTYVRGTLRYEYTVLAAGSRSERRRGRLFEGDQEIVGTPGEIRDTALGRFAYFGDAPGAYHAGWLNTLTYDKPVFGASGGILPELSGYFGDFPAGTP